VGEAMTYPPYWLKRRGRAWSTQASHSVDNNSNDNAPVVFSDDFDGPTAVLHTRCSSFWIRRVRSGGAVLDHVLDVLR